MEELTNVERLKSKKKESENFYVHGNMALLVTIILLV